MVMFGVVYVCVPFVIFESDGTPKDEAPDHCTVTSPNEELEWFNVTEKSCVVPFAPETGLLEDSPSPLIVSSKLASALIMLKLRSKTAIMPNIANFVFIML